MSDKLPDRPTDVYHDSGVYLGRLTGTRGDLVFFDGPRMRDGLPVRMATIHETYLVEVDDE